VRAKKTKQGTQQKTQAERFLEAAKERRANANSFQRDMGKLTLQRDARKKMG
jgi:hypothetical protein